jgi:CRP-like cAMP-binding protein
MMMQAVLKRSWAQWSMLSSSASPTAGRRKDDAPALTLVGPRPAATPGASRDGVRAHTAKHTIEHNVERVRRERATELIRDEDAGQLISDDHAAQLAALLHWQRLRADDDLFGASQGSPSDKLVLLLRGEVCLELQRAPNEPRVWSLFGPGQWLGELPLGPRCDPGASMRYVACGDVELGVLPLASLRQLMLNHPALAASLLMLVSHQLALRLRSSHERALFQHQWMAAAVVPDPHRGRDTELDLDLVLN